MVFSYISNQSLDYKFDPVERVNWRKHQLQQMITELAMQEILLCLCEVYNPFFVDTVSERYGFSCMVIFEFVVYSDVELNCSILRGMFLIYICTPYMYSVINTSHLSLVH